MVNRKRNNLSYILLFIFVVFSPSAKCQIMLSKSDSLNIAKWTKQSIEEEKNGNSKKASQSLEAIGMLYWARHCNREALSYLKQSAKLLTNQNNRDAASLNKNIAEISADLSDYASAYDFFKKNLSYVQSVNDKSGIIDAQINLSVVQNQLKKYKETIAGIEDALSIAQNMKDNALIKSCIGILAETYVKAGENDKALFYYKQYKALNEQRSAKKSKAIDDIERSNKNLDVTEKPEKRKEIELQRTEHSLRNEKSDMQKTGDESKMQSNEHQALSVPSPKTQQTVNHQSFQLLLAVIFFLCLVLLVFFYLIRKIKAQKKQRAIQLQQQIYAQKDLGLAIYHDKILTETLSAEVSIDDEIEEKAMERPETEELSTKELILHDEREIDQAPIIVIEKTDIPTHNLLPMKHRDITKNINDAFHVQEAMMHTSVSFSSLFPESFVFYMPKNVISSDFYWYKKIDEERSLIAIGSGHGVPGAFMSLFSASIIRQIVDEQGEYQPERVLDLLDQGVFNSLNENFANVKNGMDAAVLLIDKEDKRISFSGAGLPLVYFQNTESHLIKGDQRPIGGLRKLAEKEFVRHDIKLSGELTFYLFSDGFIDQLDKHGTKKFQLKHFKRLLSEIQDLSMEDQFGSMVDTLDHWKGEHRQSDDILVLGAKVSM